MSLRRYLIGSSWLSALLLIAAPASAAPFVVYDDALQNGYQDWSWATHNLASASAAHSGTAGISADLSGYSGVYFHRDGGLATDPVVAIDLWVRTSGDATLAFLEDGGVVGQATLSALYGSALPANTWVAIHATTSDL